MMARWLSAFLLAVALCCTVPVTASPVASTLQRLQRELTAAGFDVATLPPPSADSPQVVAGPAVSRAALPPSKNLPGVLADGSLLLDLDNGTTVFEGLLDWRALPSGSQHGGDLLFTHSFSYNSVSEFAVLTLNASSDQIQMDVGIVGGLIKLASPAQGDVWTLTENYLGSSGNPSQQWERDHPYQTFQFKPSDFTQACMAFPTACPMKITLSLKGTTTDDTPMVPYRLSLLRGPMLQFNDNQRIHGVPLGRTLTFGLEVNAGNTDVLFQEVAIPPGRSYAVADVTTDTRMYLYNAVNTVQYWFPTVDTSSMHEFGAEIDVLMEQGSFALSSSGQRRPPLQSRTSVLPTVNGHPYADPNVRSGSLPPSLYLITISPSTDSKPQQYDIKGITAQDKTMTYFELLVTPNCTFRQADVRTSLYASEAGKPSPQYLLTRSVFVVHSACLCPGKISSASFGVSMFGIIGALTVLLLSVPDNKPLRAVVSCGRHMLGSACSYMRGRCAVLFSVQLRVLRNVRYAPSSHLAAARR
jgi:hypothetical protein